MRTVGSVRRRRPLLPAGLPAGVVASSIAREHNFHSSKLFYLPTDRKNMFFSAFQKQLWFQDASALTHRADQKTCNVNS
jgi:hypothetical protein